MLLYYSIYSNKKQSKTKCPSSTSSANSTIHWRRATIAAATAVLHVLVSSVVALFAAAATQIGRTRKTQ